MHKTFFHIITWYPSKYSFPSLEKGSVHFCYYAYSERVRVKGSAWHRSLSSVLKSQRWAAMPHFTRRAVPPGLARHPGRRGTRFVGEAGSPGKAGSPRNRARRGTGIKVKNVVRAQTRWLIVAYAWPAQQTWSRYWDSISERMEDFISECMVDLSIWHSVLAMNIPRSQLWVLLVHLHTYHQSWQPALANFTRAKLFRLGEIE